MKKNLMLRKKALGIIIVSTMIFNVVPLNVFGATTLFEQVDTSTIVKGVTYENKHRLTTEGWLDLHILTVDLNNSDISVESVLSENGTGLKETVSSLLADAGAVAGANSAFFGLSGTHSVAFGPHIIDGEIVSLDADKNLTENQFGTYFADEDGNSNFEYITTYLNFYVDGISHFEIAGINSITEMAYPVYIDRTAMNDTSEIDSRFANITKIVVENNFVSKISEKGEVVEIPPYGYVITLNENYADKYIENFKVGQIADFQINSNINLDSIENSISGGGIILKNGFKPADLGEVPTGRNPRTLLGVSEDGETMKIIVAEGKRSSGSNSSIGLTVDEAVEVLKSEGMFNGINLDGGGSTIMTGKKSYEDSLENLSSPAESSERKVVAAVGIFDHSEVGDIEKIVLTPSSENAIKNMPISFEIFGYDENYHKLNIDVDKIELSCDTRMGEIVNNKFIPKQTGNAIVTATYNEMSVSTIVNVSDIGGISIDKNEVSLNVNQTYNLNAKVISTSGHELSLDNSIQYESNMGTIENGVFTALTEGSGFIKCSYGDVETFIQVNIGTEKVSANSFENIEFLEYSAYPENIEGGVGVSSSNYSDGEKGLHLLYSFEDSSSTQAAYLDLVEPIEISGEPVALSLDVKGNGLSQWVRAKIIDGNNEEHVIDFSRDVNWTDWQTVSAEIPQNVQYPISLKTIYVAALTNTETEPQSMYFDNLKSETPKIDESYVLPSNIENFSTSEGNTEGMEEGFEYFNLTGNVVGNNENMELYTDVRVQVNNALGENSNYSVFAGTDDISAENGTEKIKWQENYGVMEKENVTLINLVAKNGGLFSTNKNQWSYFVNDAKNTNNRNIIIYLDKNPDSFTDKEESQFFKDAVEEIADLGKNVYVVYSGNENYSFAVHGGAKYIALPNLWKESGIVNNQYKMLRIKASEDEMIFQAIDLF